MPRTLAVAILAGGRARRLGGVAKGLVEVGGEPILGRQLRALDVATLSPRIIVANDAAPYADYAARFDARIVPDRVADCGPLGGLDAALTSLEAPEHPEALPAVLIVGCDLPFIARDHALVLAESPARSAALVPRIDGKPQPLFARYDRSILPVVRARLERGAYKMMELLAEVDTGYIDVDWRRALMNVNTPEDLARANELAKT
jgi:molybdenum cofactor guanylyltransferase